MKLMIDQKMFSDVVAFLASYTAKVILEIGMGNIYLEARADNLLDCRVTNGKVYLQALIPAIVSDPGAALVCPKLLTGVLTSMRPGDLAISGKRRLTFKQTGLDRRLATRSMDIFPAMPITSGEMETTTIDIDVLLEKMATIVYAIGKEDMPTVINTPTLQGIYLDLEIGMAVTSDGYRAAMVEFPRGEYNPLLLMPQGIDALKRAQRISILRANSVEIGTEENGWNSFRTNNLNIFTNVWAGTHPATPEAVEAWLPDNPTVIGVRKKDLIGSLKLAASFGKKIWGVVLEVENGALRLGIETEAGKQDDIIPGTIDGPDTIVKTSPAFLLEAVKYAPEEEIELRIKDPSSPICVAAGEYLSVQVPMGDQAVVDAWDEKRAEKQVKGDEEW